MTAKPNTISHVDPYKLAIEAYQNKEYHHALSLMQGVLQRASHNVDMLNFLGVCHYMLNEHEQAERWLRASIAIKETDQAFSNLGLVLQACGRLDEAADAYRRALKIQPLIASACNNLANILTRQRRHEEAISFYRQALRANPNYAYAHKNIGGSLIELKRDKEAEEAFRRAIELDPNFTDAKLVLADLLAKNDRLAEAIPFYRAADAWASLQFEKRLVADWDDLAEIDGRILTASTAGTPPTVAPWRILHIPGMTPDIERTLARTFAEKEVSELRTEPLCKAGPVEHEGRQLRIGYLSADFYNHATMHLMTGVIEAHDRTDHEFFIFSYSARHEDRFTQRLAATGLPLIDLLDMSDRDAAELIASYKLDILVDLKGYTRHARVAISALRPAPIIVSWLGYPGTLGHERLADYIIGDRIVSPPEHRAHFSERLALMPHSYQPNDSSRPLPEPASRAAAGLPETGFVFCSFNQIVKLNPATFDVWARLLIGVAGSVLWLLRPKSETATKNIVKEFAKRGVTADRLILADIAPQFKHTARLRLADLALDTFPCTSHTTASDALWAGVPLVTLIGNSFSGRVAASLLETHGLSDLITQNEDEYFRLSLRIATDRTYHNALKKQLEDARTTSPLYDEKQFAADLEALYAAIIRDHNAPSPSRVVAISEASPLRTKPETPVDDHADFDASVNALSSGRLDEAIMLCERQLRKTPHFAEAHNLLGVCLMNANRLEKAERAFKTATELRDSAVFYENLAATMLKRGDAVAAEAVYRKAIALPEPSANAFFNLGNLLANKQSTDEAAQFYRSAAELSRDDADMQRILGMTLFRLRHNSDAEAVLRRAISLDASATEAKRCLADLLMAGQRPGEAIELYREIGALGWLQFAMRGHVIWDEIAQVDAAFLEEVRLGTAAPVSPWCVLHLPDLTPELELNIARTYVESRPNLLSIAPLFPPGTPVKRNGRLRIGYLSSDFHNHATVHLLAGVLAAHDRDNFDIRLYSYGPQVADEGTAKLDATGLALTNLFHLSDDAAAQCILNDHIDILVDLKGHTGMARPGISCRRPAPIIVNWLGHPGTLGHPRMADYIITDAHITPTEAAPFFSERLALMPNCYQPNDNRRVLGNAPSKTQAGLPQDGFVFCTFNQVEKFNPATFDIWARLLSAVRDSVLWLLQPKSPHALNNIIAEFAARGINENRLVFAPPAAQTDHIARLQLADLALDTFRYTSHTTASDTLWAGVPLVTMKGDTFASRVAASILTTHGFAELVTDSEADYFNLALNLATNPQRLAELKTRLDHARLASPLFDTMRFTRDLEALYRAIVTDHTLPDAQKPAIVTGHLRPARKPEMHTSFQAALHTFNAGEVEKATAQLMQFLSDFPEVSDAHNLLGICLGMQNLMTEAENAFRAALSIEQKPAYFENLAKALSERGDKSGAIAAYRAQIELGSTSTNAHVNLGNLLLEQGDEEGLSLYRRALENDPGNVAAKQNLAFALMPRQHYDEVIRLFASIPMRGYLLWALRTSVTWRDIARHNHNYIEHLEAGDICKSSPFCLLATPGTTPRLERLVARDSALATVPALTAPALVEPATRVDIDGRKLRIGYISHDFYDHATMYLLAGVLEQHDRTRHDIFIFSYNEGGATDGYSKRLEKTGIPVEDISGETDENAARLIAKRKLDILVDLKGHTGSARLGITARRPAPVIVNWLGYPGTLGHERLADYIIGDAIVTPAQEAAHYSERIAHMPHCYQPNDRTRPYAVTFTRAESGLPDDAFVFCSFNQTTKLNPETFEIWMRLLNAVAGSVLWLLQPSKLTIAENLRNEAVRRGVDPTRLIFAPKMKHFAHLGRLGLADLALDTFPYTSHTTASDALWAGVPLITMRGNTFAGSVAASILTTHGFSDLVTDNEGDLFSRALDLATHPERLADMRARLERARLTSPLFDTGQFARDLEALFGAIVRDHNLPPKDRPAIVRT